MAMEPLDFYVVPIALSVAAAVIGEGLRQSGVIRRQRLPVEILAIAAAVEIVWLVDLLSHMGDEQRLNPLLNHPAPMTDGGILLVLSGYTFILWLVLLAMN